MVRKYVLQKTWERRSDEIHPNKISRKKRSQLSLTLPHRYRSKSKDRG